MTPPFLLDIQAAHTDATREYFARARPWASTPVESRATSLTWFVEDATKAVSAACWEIDSFVRSLAVSHHTLSPLARQSAADINATAAAVRATADAALRYAAAVRQACATIEPAVGLASLDYWVEKCRAGHSGAFDHWEPLQVPTPEQVAGWSAGGDFVTPADCLEEIAAGLPPEERDELHRRVAAGG